jgi:hypothetical protein
MTSFSLNRRNFLQASFGSALGLMSSRLAFATPDKNKGKSNAKAPACIILWLQGGPSQMETWDPKPNHKNGGSTKALKTKTTDLLLGEALSRLAARSQDLMVVRSLNSTEGDHRRATYFVKTGQKPLANMRYPNLAAVAAYAAQQQSKAGHLPPYLRIGPLNNVGLPGQGYLPSDFAPFLVERAGQNIPDLHAPKELSYKRQKRRAKLLGELDKDFAKKAGDKIIAARQVALEKALSFRGRPETKAFDLNSEDSSLRDKYGQNPFGQSCLLARRLVENGARCVEVVQGGWDTHDNVFNRTKQLGGQLDQAFAALIDDLKARNRLSSTLIVCMGEFGRTPVINPREGRDHYPRVFGAALAGRNIRPGVYGSSSNDGLTITKNPLSVPDLFATCVKAMGMKPAKEFMVGDRPITLSKGKVCKALLKI